jgi:outer membrane protein assembly factor BamC
VVSGCSHLPFAHKVNYTSAKPGVSLEVPPDLTRPEEDQRYSVPEATSEGTLSTYKNEAARRAPESVVLPPIQTAHVEREGNARWLVVQGTPDAIWPRVKAFWAKMGYTLAIDDPKIGIMETNWEEKHVPVEQGGGILHKWFGSDAASSGVRNKYHTRFERGADGKTTEIYISLRSMEAVSKSSLLGTDQVWQPTAPNPELEAEMLNRLMISFGLPESEASAVESEPTHAKLSGQDNDIVLDTPIDRAWRRVGLALDRIGFTVEDQDRSKGIYFVNYADPEMKGEDKSFLSSLEFWKDKQQIKPQKYRIQIKAVASGSVITVLDKDGFSEHTETSAKILRLLFEQLK